MAALYYAAQKYQWAWDALGLILLGLFVVILLRLI